MSTSDIERPDLIAVARCTETSLVVTLVDGRTLTVPLWWYPRLACATVDERARVEIGRFGLHWPALDEDIELAGLLAGAKAPGATPPARVAERT